MTYLTSTLAGLVLTSLAGATFLACNGGGADHSPEGQIATFCSEVIPEFCQATFSCCTTPGILDNFNGSVGACESQQADSCNDSLTQSVLPQIEAGTIELDEGQLATCLETLETEEAGGIACVEPPGITILFTCLSAFRGKLAPGAACDAPPLAGDQAAFLPCKDGICVGGKCEAFLATGAKCAPELRDASKGALCNFPKNEWCIGSAANPHCGPRGKLGEACGDPGGSPNLSCESTICGADGRCASASGSELCAN